MLKVKVGRLGTGLAASGLLLQMGVGPLGCATAEDVGDTLTERNLVADPGAANLEVSFSYVEPGDLELAVVDSTTDEFVRVGEHLTMSIPLWMVWFALYPQSNQPDPQLAAGVSARIKVKFFRDGELVDFMYANANHGWVGGEFYNQSVVTQAFIVPDAVDTIAFAIEFLDANDPAVGETYAPEDVSQIPVFGGQAPLTHLLFDSDYGNMRQRIIEGGNPMADGQLQIGYTDWRADTLVDASSIDRQIGTADGFGRFGNFEQPIFGQLVHEISYGVDYGDGVGFHDEVELTPDEMSRLLPRGRTSFEALLDIPENATRISLYFHIRTILIADYSNITDVTQAWYEDGQRITVREAWDNPFGAYSNYEFDVDDQ